MAFDNLTEKLNSVFKKLSGKGKVNESDVKEAMRMVKLALLEADVNFKVVKNFISSATEKAIGVQVLESLTPAQQVIKIVKEELTELMGSEAYKPVISPKSPSVYMLMGLQGAGKTTTCAKIASYFSKQNKNTLLVACDIYRPAAIEQLKVVGSKVGADVFSLGVSDPVKIAVEAVDYARNKDIDIVILDTAGRLHIDEGLMEELQRIRDAVNPTELYLTLDAMTGQDAVNVAKSFDEQIGIDATILTKLDGDARGGAALSIRAVVGKPIVFCGMGEKLDDLDLFYPDRMASRILGMGDVLTLIDKAQEAFDEKQAIELEKKIRSQTFNLNDFLDQFQQMKKMGPMDQLLGMLPGVDNKALKGLNVDDRKMAQTEAIIKSMTMLEREKPSIIDYSRRKRIAAGSGTTLTQVNALLKQFEQMQKMMKQFTNPKQMKKFKGLSSKLGL
ncbi:MAG: signal recognition particle protein [Clostridia bacterium]|nr:signal recognition particle protein [Clostridia bacterium]